MNTQINNNIANCEFLTIIYFESAFDPNIIQTAYCEFIVLLQNEVDTNLDYPVVFRMLAELDAILGIEDEGRGDVGKYIQLAHKRVKSELALLEKKLSHPELFTGKKVIPELYWGEKFPKRCLIELFAAVHLVGAIVDKYGKSVDFRTLIRSAENLLNVSLPYAHKERVNVMSRSKKSTFFLEFLTSKLKERIKNVNS